MKNPANTQIFKDKIKEEEENLLRAKQSRNMIAFAKADCDPSEQVIADYWYQRKSKEVLEIRTRIKRFEWLVRVSKGRTPKEELNIDKAKQVLIPEVLPLSPAQKYGDRWKYSCPLHQEDTASFVYYVKQNSWYCYGACATGGDVITLVMKRDNVSFPEAIKLLT